MPTSRPTDQTQLPKRHVSREKNVTGREFKLGDKVRVIDPTLDRRGLVYEVDVITPIQVRAHSGDAVLCLRKEKWTHA